jgi:ubiquinone/menaquinone biosynthesis C-methylase UbiE
MAFQDNFSRQSALYAQVRPNYPKELYQFIIENCQGHERAWDCATGNGQAALALADYFDEVIATDASARQLAEAVPNPKVQYRLAPAEASGLADQSVDLITVATALHWFDLEGFYAEVKRVARPGAVVAAWGYWRTVISPEVDAVVEELREQVLGPYWSSSVENVRGGYEQLAFPFTPIAVSSFEIKAERTLEEFLRFVDSWSATVAYREAEGRSPAAGLLDRLQAAWGPGKRTVVWPLTMRVGRV